MRFLLLSVALLALLVLQASCFVYPGCVSDCDKVPDVAIAEIRTHGVTITSSPDLVTGKKAVYFDASSDEEPYVLLYAETYFSPHPDADELHHLDAGDYYEFYYEVKMDEEYLAIPKSDVIEDDFSSNQYYGTVRGQKFPNDLILFGNHLLYSNTSIPARATHISFWYQKNDLSEKELLTRTALENLAAWRSFAKPLIDENLNN